MGIATIASRLALAALLIAASAARADAWADAQAAFDDRDDRRALALLAQGAEAGDVRAQRALGLALRHAARLYPAVLQPDPAASAHWLAKAAANMAEEARVPASKRTRAGRYLDARQAWALKSNLGDRVLFLDIRTRAEAAYVGMPDTADALVPYLEHDEFMSEWDEARSTFRATANGRFADDVARALARQGLDRDATLVLICRSGDRSARAADLLADLGYSRVVSVVDGFEGDLSPQGRRDANGWKNAGLPWSYRLDRDKAQFSRR